MFQILNKLVGMPTIRGFHRSVTLNSSNLGSNLHRVNNLEKRFLVWTKKYKSIDDVPKMVPSEIVDKARNKIRIRVSNIMMGSTLVACLFIAISGKRAHERGESVMKDNLAWHKQVKEDHDAAEAKLK